MVAPEVPEARATRRSICFIQTGPAMVHVLTGEGPDAMGGAELQLYLLGRELRRRGWEVCYLVGDYGQAASSLTDEGMRVEVAYNAGQHGAPAGTAKALCRFWQALQMVDADVYVTRGLTAQTGVVAAFARAHGKQSLFWFAKNADAFHSVPQMSRLPFYERVPAWYGMRHADAIVCQTRQQLELLEKHVGRSAEVIRNVTPWPTPDAPPEGGEGVLWVGSIQPKKRPELLLDVAAELPEITFTMAGGRTRDHDELYEQTTRRAAGLPNVDFIGFVPHTEIGERFRSADILVSTSDGDQEGFPNVFLQAWSMGLPVVATCDPDGVIEQHRLGSVCASKAELVEAIRDLNGDRGLRDRVSLCARGYVEEQHSPRQIGNQLERLLDRLLGVEASEAEPAGERASPR